MASAAFTAPILPGKLEQFKRFIDELNGARKRDFDESRRKVGVWERAYHQHTPEGDVAIVTLEGDNPEESFRKFASGNDPFTRWFIEQVKEIHGFDLVQIVNLPWPRLALDSGELSGRRQEKAA